MHPTNKPMMSSQPVAAAAAAAAPAASQLPAELARILQTAHVSLDPPKNDEVWSSWYTEAEDTFADFKSYEPATAAADGAAAGGAGAAAAAAAAGGGGGSGASQRTLSARQISGQFDEEVAKSWEEDWEDEDVDDTLDSIMGQISRIEASSAARVAGE